MKKSECENFFQNGDKKCALSQMYMIKKDYCYNEFKFKNYSKI